MQPTFIPAPPITKHVSIIPFPAANVTSGTFNPLVESTAFMGGYLQSPSTVDNYAEWSVYLKPGTYTLYIYYGKGSNFGIVTPSIDGSDKTTYDGYNATQTYNNLYTETGIVISNSGEVKIRLRSASKNALSTAYYTRTQLIQLIKTA